MKILEVSTTCASQSQAKQLVNKIVREKLAACANYWKISSVYWWNGKLQRSGEWLVVFKTAPRKKKKIEKKLLELHRYKVPALIFTEVQTTPQYGKWVESI